VSITVNPSATSTTLAAFPNPGIAGKSVAVTATVKLTQGVASPTGSVTFMDTSNGVTVPLGSATLNAGTATINPRLAPGAHSIVATYGGDASDSGSVSAPLALMMQLATTSASVTSSLSPSLVLTPILFTATIKGNGGIPTGSVSFLSDGVTIGSATLNADEEATLTYSALAVGSHLISVVYAGDNNDAGSTSSSITQVVQAIPTATALGSSSTTSSPPQLILVATVVGSTGPTPTGTVTFSNGSTVIGIAILGSSGVGTLTPDLPAGTYSIIAAYSGDALHSPSTSAAVSISNPPTGFDIKVTPSSVTMATTQNATVTVALTSNNSFTDTIGLGCASLPSGINCHFSTPNAALMAGGTQTVQLTIDTNSPLSGGSSAMNSSGGIRGSYMAGLFFPISFLFGWIFWHFRKRHAVLFTSALALLLSTAAFFVTGCGGFSQSSAVPGTYVIQVTGVGTTSNISHYQNVTLTITK
jgi:hypothetical protein